MSERLCRGIRPDRISAKPTPDPDVMELLGLIKQYGYGSKEVAAFVELRPEKLGAFNAVLRAAK